MSVPLQPRNYNRYEESNISVTLSLSNTTGISQAKADKTSSKAYTLQGTIAQAGYKGFVIQDGKKIIR